MRPRRDRDRWAPYKSGLEYYVAKSMEDRGIEFGYECETLAYRRRVVKGVCGACEGDKVYQRRTYLPDFRIRAGDGASRSEYIYIETKGRLTASDRAKMVAVKQDNPGLDIRFIFGANNKLQKNKNERYSDWADKHGFPYFIGSEFPSAWVQATSGVQVDSVRRSEGGGGKAEVGGVPDKGRRGKRNARRSR